jgi:putative SOS response-associated peptidase YedK
MCYTATQVTKAYDLQDYYLAKPTKDLPEETKYFKAFGFDHPKLFVVIDRNGERLIDLYQWGLMATWAKPLEEMLKIAKGTLNARSEDVRSKSSYRKAILNQRCVIPVNSFFEYKHEGKNKLPHLIHPKEQPFFNLAGLYSFYKNPANGEWFKTFTIVTEPANTFMADIHNSAKRMPLMLSNDLVTDWLNPDSPPSMVDDIMRYACDDSSLEAYQIRRDLKSAPNDDSVLKPVE